MCRSSAPFQAITLTGESFLLSLSDWDFLWLGISLFQTGSRTSVCLGKYKCMQGFVCASLIPSSRHSVVFFLQVHIFLAQIISHTPLIVYPTHFSVSICPSPNITLSPSLSPSHHLLALKRWVHVDVYVCSFTNPHRYMHICSCLLINNTHAKPHLSPSYLHLSCIYTLQPLFILTEGTQRQNILQGVTVYDVTSPFYYSFSLIFI